MILSYITHRCCNTLEHTKAYMDHMSAPAVSDAHVSLALSVLCVCVHRCDFWSRLGCGHVELQASRAPWTRSHYAGTVSGWVHGDTHKHTHMQRSWAG